MIGGLGNLAVILVFTVIFFVLLTQRMMLSTDYIGSPVKIGERSKNVTTTGRATPMPLPHIKVDAATIQKLIDIKKGTQSTSNIRFGGGDSEPLVIDQTHIPTQTEPTRTIETESITSQPTRRPVAIPTAPPKVETTRNGWITFLDSPKRTPTTPEPRPGDNVPSHPFESPRRGSDIGLQHQTGLLLCPNQSKCIVPELQLQRKYKIYLCSSPGSHGVRFYYLARDGLLLHPNVELLGRDSMAQADYFVYLPGSTAWHHTECRDPSFARRMVVLDEFDGHTLITPTMNSSEFTRAYGKVDALWYFTYFKRSFVRRTDGHFHGYPHLTKPDTYPLTYAVAEEYIALRFNHKREIEISCTLRGSEQMQTRQRVVDWVREYGESRKVSNMIAKELNGGGRREVNQQYFAQMRNSQIIVTVNPAQWEGDFRLWEAMCTGALIFVDPIFVPHPFPLQHGVHVVYFSNSNRTDLWTKLDYYRSHPEEARQIAINGYLHAMKYHRTVNLIDYVLRSTHVKEAQVAKLPPPRYAYTGQYLNSEAALQEEAIRDCHTPGLYHDVTALNASTDLAAVPRLQCVKRKRGSPGSNINFSR